MIYVPRIQTNVEYNRCPISSRIFLERPSNFSSCSPLIKEKQKEITSMNRQTDPRFSLWEYPWHISKDLSSNSSNAIAKFIPYVDGINRPSWYMDAFAICPSEWTTKDSHWNKDDVVFSCKDGASVVTGLTQCALSGTGQATADGTLDETQHILSNEDYVFWCPDKWTSSPSSNTTFQCSNSQAGKSFLIK